MAVSIPITSPFKFKSGPPEFPSFIAASVWIIPCKVSVVDPIWSEAEIVLCNPETTPTETVFENYVREAKDYIEHNKVTDIVMTLPSQQQKVLESILYLTKEKEEITSGRLYEVYKEFSKGDSVSYRRIFDFINELEMLGLISTKTISRVRGKGRTNIIDLQCEMGLLEDAIWNG